MKIKMAFITLMLLAISQHGFTKENLYEVVNLSNGMSLEVPSHWNLISKDNRKNILVSARALVENSGVAGAERNETSLLVIKALPEPSGAIIRVDAVIPPDYTQEEIESLTEENLQEFSKVFIEQAHKMEKKGGARFISMNEIKIEKIGEHKALYYSYSRASLVDESTWTVYQYNIPVKNQLIEVTISHRDSDKLLWIPIVQKVKNSIVLPK